jgi:hypothetical protein
MSVRLCICVCVYIYIYMCVGCLVGDRHRNSILLTATSERRGRRNSRRLSLELPKYVFLYGLCVCVCVCVFGVRVVLLVLRCVSECAFVCVVAHTYSSLSLSVPLLTFSIRSSHCGHLSLSLSLSLSLPLSPSLPPGRNATPSWVVVSCWTCHERRPPATTR